MSVADLPLIGCRISIISKAKIRYEGFLHSIDTDTPNEPVITLSKVWSFGTEDRACDRYVAPRNEEYNQVVFRGRDLEDVRLVSSVFLNEDSAIVSAAPGSSIPTHPPSLQTNDSVTSKEDASRNRSTTAASTGSGRFTPPVSRPQSRDDVSQSTSNQTLTTFQLPTVIPRPGPIGNVQPEPPQGSVTRGPRPFGDGRSEADTGANVLKRADFVTGGSNRPDFIDMYNRQHDTSSSIRRYDTAPQRGWGKREPLSHYGSSLYGRGTAAMGYTTHDQNRGRRNMPSNQWSMNYRGNGQSPGYQRRAGRVSSGSNRGWSRSHTGVPTVSSEPTSFADEYDYEKANAELAAELEKICIGSKSAGSTTGSSADADPDKADGSGSSHAGDEPVFYDKSKSFFDSISSEMMDRANGVTPHSMNRRDERRLNSATFGTTLRQFERYPMSRRAPYGNQRMNSYGGYAYGSSRRGTSGSGSDYWRSGNHENRNNSHTIVSGSSTSAA